MLTVSKFLKRDHIHCDQLFDCVEECVDNEDWLGASAAMQRFSAAMEQHIGMEEQILYPALERTLVQGMQPVAMLRVEHRQLSMLLIRLDEAVKCQARNDFLLHAETFALLRQQHDMKEDELLYPFLDQLLVRERDAILFAMQAMRIPCGVSESVSL